MKKSALFAAWGGMFILCAGLGFIPGPEGALRGLLTAAALVFFLPPALILWQANNKKDWAAVRLVRNLSLLSLGLTALLIVLNIACAMASPLVGSLLNSLLTVISSPMICWGNWALSLFCWACLMVVSFSLLRKK